MVFLHLPLVHRLWIILHSFISGRGGGRQGAGREQGYVRPSHIQDMIPFSLQYTLEGTRLIAEMEQR